MQLRGVKASPPPQTRRVSNPISTLHNNGSTEPISLFGDQQLPTPQHQHHVASSPQSLPRQQPHPQQQFHTTPAPPPVAHSTHHHSNEPIEAASHEENHHHHKKNSAQHQHQQQPRSDSHASMVSVSSASPASSSSSHHAQTQIEEHEEDHHHHIVEGGEEEATPPQDERHRATTASSSTRVAIINDDGGLAATHQHSAAMARAHADQSELVDSNPRRSSDSSYAAQQQQQHASAGAAPSSVPRPPEPTTPISRPLALFASQDEEEAITSKDPEFSLPWDYRNVDKKEDIPTCSFAGKAYFWKRVQWAIQFTLLSCIPAAILAFHANTRPWFKTPGFLLPFCVVCTNSTAGRAVTGLIDVTKALVLVIIVLTLMIWVDVARHWAAWGTAYFLGTFCIAYFTENIVTKNALLVFTVGLVTHYNDTAAGNPDKQIILFPSYMVRDICIGAAFGVASAWLPFPYFNYSVADECTHRLATSCSTAILGLAESFFLMTNVQRTANIIKVRYVRTKIADDLAALQENTSFGWNEPVLGLHLAELQVRLALFTRMSHLIDSMLEVAEFIQSHSDKIERCKQTQIFEAHFHGGFMALGNHIDKALHLLAMRRLREEDSKQLQAARERYDQYFHRAMLRALFYSEQDDQQQSRHASPAPPPTVDRRDPTLSHLDSPADGTSGGLRNRKARSQQQQPQPADNKISLSNVSRFPRVELGFFMFNLVAAIEEIRALKEPEIWSFWERVAFTLSPMDLVRHTQRRVTALLAWKPDMVAIFIYALKVSFCMTTTVILLLSIESKDPVFSGAAVIGFVAGGDTAQTVQTSLMQLVGTVFGSILGFLLSSADSSVMWLVISVGIVALTTGFFRSSHAYGLVAFFAQFAAFGSITPQTDSAFALQSIQQNVGAIVWFFIVSSTILPQRPSDMLFAEMKNGMDLMKGCISEMESLLTKATALSMIGGSAIAEEEYGGGGPATLASSLHMPSVAEVEKATDKQRASIARQVVLLTGARVEPTLSDKTFPAHLVERTIEQQNKIVALLAPLARAWTVTTANPTASSDSVLLAVVPYLSMLNKEASTLMGLLILLLDRDVASLTRLVVASCLRLQEVSRDLRNNESEATYRNIAASVAGGGASSFAASSMNSAFGTASPESGPMRIADDMTSLTPEVLSVVHCCSSLAHELFTLYLVISEMRQAIQAM